VDAYLAVVSRREVREYDGRPLPEAAVRRILEAGRLAGSSKNRQQRRFVAVRDGDVLARLAEAVWNPGNVRESALAVAVVTWGKGPTSFDAGRAAQNMMLAAWNEGIGSCPNGFADPEAARAALEPGEEEQLASVISFGYPAHPSDPERRPPEHWVERADRRPLEDVVEWR
jgi:nitroreductase